MKKIFIIRDIKAEVYNNPVFADSTGRIVRMFSDMINGPKDNEIAKHPEDFCLFEIGTFDSNTGKITLLEAPISLGIGLDFVTAKGN